MIKNIITYPTPTGIEYAPDVRVFDDELFAFIDDLKETMVANSLDGLAAAQVGSYYNLVVVKNKDKILELINPRILSKKGEIKSLESTSYFPDIKVQISRYESISLVYEDREGNSHSLKADGDFSILLQRKIDYLFGANFLTKLKGKERDDFENLLISNGVSCPTQSSGFSRDYFVNVANYILVIMLFLLGVSFVVDSEKFWNYQLYLSFSVVFTNILYILYSYYENKKFNICTNCYNMSIFGVVGISFMRLSIIMLISYFILN
jgi:peptide deformylase